MSPRKELIFLPYPSPWHSPSHSTLPVDHFNYRIPRSDETLEFWNYGSPLSREDVIYCLQKAIREIDHQPRTDAVIDDMVLQYASRNVRLLVHHGGIMTWDVWRTAVRGILDFVTTYECVDFDFDVGQPGLASYFGTGALTRVS